MLDNSFQVRYDKLPIATYTISDPPLREVEPFMLMHQHKEFEVIAVESGCGNVTIDQQSYDVSAGDLLLIPPYSIHSGLILPGEAFSHFCFCFDLSLLKEPEFTHLMESGCLDIERVIDHSCSDAAALHDAALAIYRQCETRARGWEFLVRGQLLVLLGLLEYRGSLSSILQKNQHRNFSAQVLDILNSHYNTNLTSRDAASGMSYSQSYFCRLFRENFSMNFQRYLCQYRLCKARLLLAEGQLSVSAVAASVGFNNLSYFARAFHRMFGCTPKEFQKMQSQADVFRTYYLEISPAQPSSAIVPERLKKKAE